MSNEAPERQTDLGEYHRGLQKAAVALMSAGLSVLALFAMLISFIPTSYNWDPEMPEYSDPDSVLFALLCSGSGLLLSTAVVLILRQHRAAWIIYLVFVALNGYSFVTLALHFQG